MTSSTAAAWRAANYLSVAQLYLRSNVLLQEPLRIEHLKQRVVGHWGTAPGMNFILVHLAQASRALNTPVMPVIGTGHAASSVLAWLYLEGTLGDFYPELSWSARGLERLIAEFGSDDVFRTELSAFLPGVFAANGEIGPAHAIAQGISLDLETPTVACVVGDGELETGPGAASLLAMRALPTQRSGPVLIINLNGLRMGARSLLGTMSVDSLRSYLGGLGYAVRIVDLPDHGAAHDVFCQAIAERAHPQVVIVRSEKGVTFPKTAGRFASVVGSPASHKAPLAAPARDEAELELLREWLASYEPQQLFQRDGTPSELVQRAFPPAELRLGIQWKTLAAPAPLRLAEPPARVESTQSPMARVEEFLAEMLASEDNRKRFRVFSPDELRSNKLAGLLEDFPDRTLEVLSEDVCHAWAEGYVRSGRHALLITYEAFASRFATSFAQFLKFSDEAKRVPFRPQSSSLTYLLTSLGWHNVFSHQNPDFISIMLLRESDDVRVYLPVNAKQLVSRLRSALASSGLINAIVASKHDVGPDLDARVAERLSSDGLAVVAPVEGPPDIVLAAAGDVACASILKAAAILQGARPSLRLRVVLIEDLARLCCRLARGLKQDEYDAAFGRDCPLLFAFIGYQATIHGLLAGRPSLRRILVVGYDDVTGCDFETTMQANGIAPEQLAQRSLQLLSGGN